MYGSEYVPDAPRRYEKQGQERPGGARGDPPCRGPLPHTRPGGRRAAGRGLRPLRPDLEAHRRLADGRRPRLHRLGAPRCHPRRRRPRRHRRAVAPAAPSSPSAASSRRTRRGATSARRPVARTRPRRSAACPGSARAPRCAPCAPRRTGTRPRPPPRYTEATLVKAMEERGIGRPSTYASTIGTIQDRGYVSNRGSALIPSWLAFAVTRLMEEHFSRLVDYDFTASMEEDLDAIARGDQQRAAWLHRFYFGDESSSAEGLRDLVEDLGDIDARAISTIDIGEGIVVRVGRYGPYVEEVVPAGIDPATGEVTDAAALGEDGAPATPRRATINDDIAPDELTPAMARELLEAAADDGRVLGQDPATGHDVVARAGRYGPYVTEVLPEADEAPAKGRGKAAKAKPRTASLFKDMDLATDRPGRRAEAALPAARRRRRPEDGRGDHRAERSLRPVPEEGHRLALDRDRAAAVRHHPRAGAGDLRPAQAARPAPPRSRRSPSSAPTRSPASRWSSRTGGSGPTSPTARPTRRCARTTTPSSSRPERGYELLADKRARGPVKKAARSTAKKATTSQDRRPEVDGEEGSAPGDEEGLTPPGTGYARRRCRDSSSRRSRCRRTPATRCRSPRGSSSAGTRCCGSRAALPRGHRGGGRDTGALPDDPRLRRRAAPRRVPRARRAERAAGDRVGVRRAVRR